jgi:hypothetical protein
MNKWCHLQSCKQFGSIHGNEVSDSSCEIWMRKPLDWIVDKLLIEERM